MKIDLKMTKGDYFHVIPRNQDNKGIKEQTFELKNHHHHVKNKGDRWQ